MDTEYYYQNRKSCKMNIYKINNNKLSSNNYIFTQNIKHITPKYIGSKVINTKDIIIDGSSGISDNVKFTQKNYGNPKAYHPMLWSTSNLINSSIKTRQYIPYISMHQNYNLLSLDSFYTKKL